MRTTRTKAFISYSHDSPEHKQIVLELANKLRADGVDCMIDRYVQAPTEGWQRWMQHQIEKADFILLICTECYSRRFRGAEDSGIGRGATWETQIIGQLLYDKSTRNDQVIPVLLDGEGEESIPIPLRPYTAYRYPSGYYDLYRQLTDQPEVLIPEVGSVKSMPPLQTLSGGAPEQRAGADYKYDVLLLYHERNKSAAEVLALRLHEQGISCERGVSPLVGEVLARSIRDGLLNSRNCAILVGPDSERPWDNEELRALLWQRVSNSCEDFRAIPVLLPGAERPSRSSLPAYLTTVGWVEFRFKLSDDAAYRDLCREILGMDPASATSFSPAINPYRGLQFFDVDDGRLFFGREAQTQWLLEKLRMSFGSRRETRFLAILGPSGSGKSSLARAGLISALKRGEIEGSSEWLFAICRPGGDPLESLAVALARATNPTQGTDSLRRLIDELRKDHRTLHLSVRLASQNSRKQLVILVDQFEEVFTLCEDQEQRQSFFNNLFYAANVIQGQTVIVITMRTDFYGKCASYPYLAAILSDRQTLVGPMSRGELRTAIERPAQLVGCEFESGLVKRLLDDAEDEPGALPLLQHALLELWKKRDGRILTNESYESIGCIEGSLERRAEDVYSLLNEHEKLLCRRILLRLTQPGDGTEDTKRRAFLRELLAAREERKEIEHIISVLAAKDARLITTTSAPGLPDEPVIEISHEALIRGWSRLRSWLEESREGLRIQRQLAAAVIEWLTNGRNESFLYDGARLANALEWSEEHDEDLNPDEREFIEASKEHDARGRRLSDSAALDQLEASAKEIWLDIPQMNVWLNRARTVAATLPDHQRNLEKLTNELARDATDTKGSVVHEDSEIRRQHDTIAVFVRRLELFNHTLKASAEHVVGLSENMGLFSNERSSAWDKAIENVADRQKYPQYGGLQIKPQIGLVPIGADPKSGLWEFCHLPTGVPPERDSEGKLIITEEMGVVLILVPAGKFNMGAMRPRKGYPIGTPNVDPYARDEEKPVHTVKLTPYFISKFPMTQGQWLRATGTNLSTWKTQLSQNMANISLLHPIEFISWNECAQALTAVGLALPTEAQWEYATRAGTSTIWWKGRDSDSMIGAANLLGCREAIYPFAAPSIVGLFDSPNNFGLHDVAGNVWEWCRDKYGGYGLKVSQGDAERIVVDGTTHVCRGGSFFNTVEYGRSAVRYYHCPPDSRFNNLGVRPARMLTNDTPLQTA